MANIFQNILVNRPKRSVFDLSYENKLSFDMGQLVPVYTENVVPGDKFKVNTEVFLRFAPLVAPVMHRINCYVHYFFVPWRLVWEDWQDFITGGEDGLQSPVFPRRNMVDSATWTADGSLCDYLGYNFPTHNNSNSSVLEYSLLPLRAYQLIYNEYYRDQNLTSPIEFSLASGDSNSLDNLVKGTSYSNDQTGAEAAYTALTTLRYRAWEKDYFTSALPFVQRGVAANIPVTLDTSNLTFAKKGSATSLDTVRRKIDRGYMADGTTPPGDDIYIRTTGEISTGGELMNFGNSTDGSTGHYHPLPISEMTNKVKIVENSEGVTIIPPTINELRLAEHIQRWLERNARGGARYIEQILSHFGVRVPDFTLQRPQYLGGGKSPVQISEVLQTSSTDSTSPQGNMAGHAYSVGNKNYFKHTFDEHGFVLGIMSVLPRTSYQTGVSRHLLKFDKFDYYFPEFAHLGEQAVLNAELFNASAVSEYDNPAGTFGYQERYAEYKYRSGEVHGDFKSTLDSWHMGRTARTLLYA